MRQPFFPWSCGTVTVVLPNAVFTPSVQVTPIV
jgi:hypothetical protein